MKTSAIKSDVIKALLDIELHTFVVDQDDDRLRNRLQDSIAKKPKPTSSRSSTEITVRLPELIEFWPHRSLGANLMGSLGHCHNSVHSK
jgi:hypothetical protein